MELGLIFRIALYISYWILVIICSLTILYELKDPIRALAWILVVVMLPVGGMILFFFFGQNLRRKIIMVRRDHRVVKYINKLYRKQIKTIGNIGIENHLKSYQQTITLLLNNSRSLLTTNNTVDILYNGQNTFDSIIEAIKTAKSFIHMEYYVLEKFDLSQYIFELLAEKVKEGVQVRILFDDVGSWKLKKKEIKKLKEKGIEICCFFPVVFPWLSSTLNNRNHRKIIVIDGIIGFTGGINIAKRYLSDKWHDTHIKIQGESVNMLQMIFLTDWFYATKQALEDWHKYFIRTKKIYGNIPIQIVPSGPNMPWASIMQAYFEIITKAKKSIYISTPYFTPTQPILTALKVASLGGINIKIMLPLKSDIRLAEWATRSYFRELLEAGIEIYLFEKGFIHTKMICADESVCSIGSVNMDERSFEDNFEVTAFMYDDEISKKVSRDFIDKCQYCSLLTSDYWEKWIHRNRFIESLSRLISPLL